MDHLKLLSCQSPKSYISVFQAAKHTAASKALKLLRDIPLPDCKSKLDPTSQPFTPGIEYDELKSPISLGELNIERAI